MWFLKKKAAPEVIDLNCPAEDCDFIAEDATTLKKHVSWKHPEITNVG